MFNIMQENVHFLKARLQSTLQHLQHQMAHAYDHDDLYSTQHSHAYQHFEGLMHFLLQHMQTLDECVLELDHLERHLVDTHAFHKRMHSIGDKFEAVRTSTTPHMDRLRAFFLAHRAHPPLHSTSAYERPTLSPERQPTVHTPVPAQHSPAAAPAAPAQAAAAAAARPVLGQPAAWHTVAQGGQTASPPGPDAAQRRARREEGRRRSDFSTNPQLDSEAQRGIV
jgi:hypothetical protein